MTIRPALTIAIALLASSSLTAATGHAASTSECPELSGKYLCKYIDDGEYYEQTVQQKKNADNSIQYYFADLIDDADNPVSINAGNDVVTTRFPDGIVRGLCSKKSILIADSGDGMIQFVKEGNAFRMYVSHGRSEFEMTMGCVRMK